MLFTRTQRYHASISNRDFISKLNGNHVKIHDLDFEVYEKNGKLRIIPHAEQVSTIKTLPITYVDVKKTGNETDIVVTSKMRRLDVAGPQLIMVFCSFLFLASFILLYVGRERLGIYTMLGIGSFILIAFCVRMQMGYFDYIRKIRTYIKDRLDFA